jgi:hypothetical protein
MVNLFYSDFYMDVTTRQVDLSRLCSLCAEPCTIATSVNLLTSNSKLASQLLGYFDVLVSC